MLKICYVDPRAIVNRNFSSEDCTGKRSRRQDEKNFKIPKQLVQQGGEEWSFLD